MQKEIYILRGSEGEDYKAFGDRALELANTVAAKSDALQVKLCLTLERPPRVSVIPFRKDRIAVLSVYLEKGNVLDQLSTVEGFAGGYIVEEALPVEYSRTWKDGETTPGACLLTLFHRKPSIDRDTFMRRWHQGHTPLSLKLHPLWNYSRNVVTDTLTDDSPWYDGIVEEQVQKAPDLLNPLKFFGPPLKVPVHMCQVLLDTRSFIDMRRIETYLASEIHIKS